MVSRHTKYFVARLGWGALTLGGMIAVVSGRTEPFLSVSQLPVGDFGVSAAGFGAALVGWFAIARLQRRAWRAAGRAVGLAAESSLLSPLGYADLSGTMGGRSVRVRIVNKQSSEFGSRRTLIEAPLSDPPETGVVVGRTASGDPADAAPSFGSISVETHAVGGEFWAVGDEALAGEVLRREVRDALRAAGEVDGVYAGDVSSYLAAGSPDASNRIAETLTAVSTSSLTPGDWTTVAWRQDDVILDPQKLERDVAVVTAVADAFEAVTTGGERTTGTEREA